MKGKDGMHGNTSHPPDKSPFFQRLTWDGTVKKRLTPNRFHLYLDATNLVMKPMKATKQYKYTIKGWWWRWCACACGALPTV
jgi:hypothetical protein